MKKLLSLFDPKTIAIVGVSDNPNKIGSTIFFNLKDSDVDLFLINPKHKELFGHKVYPSIQDIPKDVDIDVAIIAVPISVIEPVIDDCARKKVKNVVIITAGFKETGQKGKDIEKRIINKLKDAGIRVLGPNCLGYLIPHKKINASFADTLPQPGDIALISQSGAIATAALDISLKRNLGFSYFVSIGNKSDINELDLIDFFNKDNNTRIISAYLEEINQGTKLLSKIVNVQKPFVLIKPGKSKKAQQAIASHTGSLAGDDAVLEAMVKKANIIRTYNFNEFINVLNLLSWISNIKSKDIQLKNIAIVTNAGGAGVIDTDLIEDFGFNMANLSNTTVQKLGQVLPKTANIHNPVDIIGDAKTDRYVNSIMILKDDPNVDVIHVILTPQKVTEITETAKQIATISKISNKPIICSFIGGKYVDAGVWILYDNKVPVFYNLVDALTALKHIKDYLEKRSKSPKYIKPNATIKDMFKNIIGEAKIPTQTNITLKKHIGKPTVISEDITYKLFSSFNIDVPDQMLTDNLEDILEFFNKHKKIVLKASTEQLVHKTDEKGVYLNLNSQDAVINAFNQLQDTLQKITGKSKNKVLAQEMIDFEEQFFIGIKRYDNWGYLALFGRGGIYTEIYQDIEKVLLPASRNEIIEALEKTKIWRIISGARGQEPLAQGKLIDTIFNIQKILYAYPEIYTIDLNPILISKDRVVAVDTKLWIK